MRSERPSRPSQRDVAELAGVSRTTVSFVINNVPDVSIPAETRQRVLDAVDQLGFRPNEQARSLRSKTSNVLGLLTSEIATTPYAVAILKGAQDTAFKHGKTLLIVDTEGAETATDNAVATMSRWAVEGLIIAADYHREVELPRGLDHTPTVMVNCFSPDAATSSVVPDEVQGGRLATSTLIDAGHRHVAFINGPVGFPASAGRLEGYVAAHRDAGIAVDRSLIRRGDWWQESGARETAHLLDRAEPPTAIFCGNDWMAMGACDIVKERGLRIPGDVAIIGFDNREEIAAHMRPRLSTVALPYYEMGQWAVEYLLDPPASGEAIRMVLPCPLVRRQSV